MPPKRQCISVEDAVANILRFVEEENTVDSDEELNDLNDLNGDRGMLEYILFHISYEGSTFLIIHSSI